MSSDVWMKTLREENLFEPMEVGASYLLEEPVWIDDTGNPRYTKEGLPAGRPSWTAGERVVLYVSGRAKTAALLQVTELPERSGNEDWPWSTPATVLAVDGPTLDELGVDPAMTMRRVRWRLTAEQALRALRSFGVSRP